MRSLRTGLETKTGQASVSPITAARKGGFGHAKGMLDADTFVKVVYLTL